MKLSINHAELRRRHFALRRRLVSSLGVGREISLRSKLLFALLIFTLSFATRTLHAVDMVPVMYTVEQPMSGLVDTYDLRAAAIVAGDGLLGPYDIKPWRTVWLAQAPGYSIFLSGVYATAGRDFFRVQVVQNAVNSVSPVLILLIAGIVLSWRVGVVTGLLAALSHHLAYMSNFILPDSLSALPVLAAWLALAVACRRKRRAESRLRSYLLFALAGVMIGLAAWLRSQLILLGPFLIITLAVIAVRRWPAVRRAAVAAAVSLLMIAPITIKNYLVYGEFVPINIGMGIVLWEGIADASGDRFGAVAKDEQVAEQDAILYNEPRYAKTWSSPDGVQRDRDRVRRSLKIIASHPVWYAGVMVRRMGDMVKYAAYAPLVLKNSQAKPPEPMLPIKTGWEGRATESSSLEFGRKLFWLRPVIRPLQRLSKEPMLYFVMAGVAVMFLASWRRSLFLFIVPLYYFLFQSFMHTEFRYTLPMQYFLFTFAAVVWVLIGVAARRRVMNFARSRKERDEAHADTAG